MQILQKLKTMCVYVKAICDWKFIIELFSFSLTYQIISDDYNLLFQAYYDTGLQIRVCIEKLFSLFLVQNICCEYSKEPSQWDGSFEHPKHMFWLMGKKIVTILRS